jgi:hypothetical protein
MPPVDNRQTYALAVELWELGPVGRRDGLDGAGGKGVEGLRQSSEESGKKKDLHILQHDFPPDELHPLSRALQRGKIQAHRCGQDPRIMRPVGRQRLTAAVASRCMPGGPGLVERGLFP